MNVRVRHALSAAVLIVFAALAVGSGKGVPATRENLNIVMEHDDLAETKRLLDEQPDFAKQKDNNGFGPLFTPARRGNLAIVQLLVERGADVNDRSTKDGWTPIIMAASKGHAEIVSFLIAKGADVKAESKDGSSAMTFAALRGYTPIVQELLKAGAPVESPPGKMPHLLGAITSGKLDAVKALVEAGAELRAEKPNGKGGKFMAPLALAKKKGFNDIVEYLASKGADKPADAPAPAPAP